MPDAPSPLLTSVRRVRAVDASPGAPSLRRLRAAATDAARSSSRAIAKLVSIAAAARPIRRRSMPLAISDARVRDDARASRLGRSTRARPGSRAAPSERSRLTFAAIAPGRHGQMQRRQKHGRARRASHAVDNCPPERSAVQPRPAIAITCSTVVVRRRATGHRTSTPCATSTDMALRWRVVEPVAELTSMLRATARSARHASWRIAPELVQRARRLSHCGFVARRTQ